MLWEGRLDLEEFQDALLGVGEAVECDAVGGVGEPEALEGEDIAAGGHGGAAFGQQARELFVVAERLACLDSMSPKISSAMPTRLVRAWMRSSLCRKIGRTLSVCLASRRRRSTICWSL